MMAKPEHLVCQHLENISSDALEKYQKMIRQYVRRRSGIYALYRGDRLYYVGLARNLRSRLKSHLRDRHRKLWDRFSVYLTIGSEHMKELESLVLRISKPIGNKVKGKFKHSENLHRLFAEDIRRSQKEEFNRLLGREMTKLVLEGKERKGRKPVLAKYVQKRLKLRTKYKGKVYKARVRRDGMIIFNGRKFYSPSKAGDIIVAKGTAVNGWHFWEYERAPGDWVSLNELRR
jgi:predicted GIY-YIG superfamily endonuclease